MSHSKRRARGQSYYLDVVNKQGNKYVHQCHVCGMAGYDPCAIQAEPNRHLIAELQHRYKALPLNAQGRFEICAVQLPGKD